MAAKLGKENRPEVLVFKDGRLKGPRCASAVETVLETVRKDGGRRTPAEVFPVLLVEGLVGLHLHVEVMGLRDGGKRILRT